MIRLYNLIVFGRLALAAARMRRPRQRQPVLVHDRFDLSEKDYV